MADMPNDFWSGWIIVLTVVSFAWLVWLVLSIYFLPATKPEEGHAPVWDENLREGSNPAPLWWFWLILSAMVFSVIYLMFYPGMGSFQGALRWSQGGQIEDSYERFTDEFATVRAAIGTMPLEDLGADSRLMAAAENLFKQNCSACHGTEGSGQASLFPDLTDDNWQWGGSAQQIEQTIRNGRMAVMVSWLPILGAQGVENVAAYVAVLGTDQADGHPGQMQYNQFCVACHGPQGAGNPLLGAPDLTAGMWLYGGDHETLVETIAQGRNGIMPAFNQRLDDTQIRLLVAWLLR
ncbi:MAG: cytochrome-c oxidase, cbb3-type subunit III [Pseudohongiellaceae bacterium]